MESGVSSNDTRRTSDGLLRRRGRGWRGGAPSILRMPVWTVPVAYEPKSIPSDAPTIIHLAVRRVFLPRLAFRAKKSIRRFSGRKENRFFRCLYGSCLTSYLHSIAGGGGRKIDPGFVGFLEVPYPLLAADVLKLLLLVPEALCCGGAIWSGEDTSHLRALRVLFGEVLGRSPPRVSATCRHACDGSGDAS